MGIDFPVTHPGVIAATRSINKKSVKHAPPVPLEFIRKVEEYASGPTLSWGLRVFCSLVCLLVYASLRYADTVCVCKLWKSDTAICGLSVNSKDKNGDLMNWATPMTGVISSDWTYPLLKFWDGIKPSDDASSVTLFPWWGKDWVISDSKKSTAGAVQATLSRLETLLGFNLKLKIHSPRSWVATCAHQLLYPREDREKLGRWNPGSLMPDLYDRSVCATELRLRDEIFEKIRSGVWKPTNAFETPGRGANDDTKAESSSASSTSGNSSDEDITDLWGTGGVIDKDGSKGYV